MATKIEKRTAELMLNKLRAKLDGLFEDQESTKAPTSPTTKMQGGGTHYGTPYRRLNRPQANTSSLYNMDQRLDMIRDNTGNVPYVPDYQPPQTTDFFNFGNSAPANFYTPANSPGLPTTSRPSTTTQSAAVEQPLMEPYSGRGWSDFGSAPMGAGLSSAGSNPGVSYSGAGLTKDTLAGANNMGGGNTGGGADWFGMGMSALSFVPGLYNMFRAFQKPEEVNPNKEGLYNPYENKALSLMRNRRFNVNPILERNLSSQRTYNRNIARTASSRGELLSNMGAGYAGRLRADSTALAEKSNQDNQYLAQEAQMMAGLGSERAGVNRYVSESNAANRAATRGFGAAASENIGSVASMLLRNRNLNEMQRLQIEALESGYPYFNEWFSGMAEKSNKLNRKVN